MKDRAIHFWLTTVILGLAALLRFYNLTWNSFDNDEAFSWHVSQKPLVALVADAFYLRGDPHPPVYWVALKVWQSLAGDSELALRWLSAAAGVIFVALTFQLGRQLFSWRAGVWAALWVTLSPYLIWNNQDVRMYTLGSVLALGGVLCLVVALKRGGWGWWLSYFALMTLACYTNIGASFTLPFHGSIAALSVFMFRRRGWMAMATLAAVSLAFAPFALNMWEASGAYDSINRYSPTLIELLHTATVALASFRAPLTIEWQWVVAIVVGGVFLLGAFFGREAQSIPSGFGRALAAAFYLTPLFVIVILSLRQPVFLPKLLVFVAGGLALGVGAGLSRLWDWNRWAGMLAGAGLIAIQCYGLGSIWAPGLQKEDWRNAANYVKAHLGSTDLVLVHLSHYQIPFDYYFRDAAPVVAPFGADPGSPETVNQIMSQFTGYDTIWLVQSAEYISDPERRVQGWLTARYPLATELFPFSISVRQFIVRPQLASLPSNATPLGAGFGESIQIAGYDLDAQRLTATEQWMHPPTNWIHLRLYGLRSGAVTGDPAIVVKVEDEGGRVWGGNMDRAGETADFFPAAAWPENTLMRLDYDLNLNTDMPPGRYKIVLRLQTAGGAFLPVSLPGAGPDYVILQRVEIIP
jgi:hypothetical protein